MRKNGGKPEENVKLSFSSSNNSSMFQSPKSPGHEELRSPTLASEIEKLLAKEVEKSLVKIDNHIKKQNEKKKKLNKGELTDSALIMCKNGMTAFILLTRTDNKIFILEQCKNVFSNPLRLYNVFMTNKEIQDKLPPDINYRTSDGRSEESDTAGIVDFAAKWLEKNYPPQPPLPKCSLPF